MTRKTNPNQKRTDAERHKRFVEMAREVGASDDPKDFETAFKRVAHPKPSSAAHPGAQSGRAQADKSEKR
jgi:hypothetical protein